MDEHTPDSPPPAPPGKTGRRRIKLSPLPRARWWPVIAATLLVGGVVVFLVLFDWNWLRGPLSKFASARLNRQVAIQGDLRVHPWSLSPRASVEGLRIAQPGWAGGGDMAQVGRVAVQVKLLPLFKGDVVLPLLAIEKPDVRLIRNAKGQANWTFGDPNAPKKPFKLPAIQHFIIADGKLRYDDAQKGLRFVGAVSSNENASGDGRGRFMLTGDGELNRAPFTARVTGGPLLNVTPNRPYPFDADVRAGTTKITARGQINKPFDLGRLGADLTVAGEDLNNLYYLTGLALPNTPPYRIAGRLERRNNTYDFNKFSGRMGASDIGGDLSVKTGGKRPMLTADLRSRRLDFADLGSLVGARETSKTVAGTAIGDGRLLPDATLQVDRIRAMDAKVRYRALSVLAPKLPLERVSLDLTLDDGLLRMEPLSFDFNRGRLSSTISLNARGETPRTDADIQLTNARLEELIPVKSEGKPAIEGALAARAKLTGYGDSVHKAAASADGFVTVVAPRGRMRQAFAELLGVNASKGLILLLSKSDKETELRCAVADFNVKNGVMNSRTLVMDTGVVTAAGKASVDLGQEKLNVRIEGDSKKTRLLRVFLPITIAGGFTSAPKIGVEPGAAIAQGGVAAALGSLLSPIAAIIPFLEPGGADDADCSGLVGQAKARGAKTNVATAPAKSKK